MAGNDGFNFFGFQIKRKEPKETIKSFTPEVKDDGAVVVAAGGTFEAFVYCWTDHKTKKLYVGYHKGKPTHKYICSSKTFLSEYHTRPQDFTRQIIAYGTVEEMLKFETKILQSINARNDPLFYNLHNGDGNFKFKGHTEESKQNLRRKAIGRKHSQKSIEMMKTTKKGMYAGQKNPMFGKSHSDETKEKISRSRKNKYAGENNPMFGKQRPDLSERNKANRGKMWFNDGKHSKQFFEQEAPFGWNKGRLL